MNLSSALSALHQACALLWILRECRCLRLSNSGLGVTYYKESALAAVPGDPDLAIKGTAAAWDPQVSVDHYCVTAHVVIARGQYYWEVDACNSSAYRIGT